MTLDEDKILKEYPENRIEIIRDYKKDGTYSKINCISNGKIVCSTNAIELRWLNNKPNESCIPEGWYKAIKSIYWKSEDKYECLEILNVKNRDYIKIHSANYIRQLRGCIAPVKEFIDIDKDGIVDGSSSRDSLTKIMTFYNKLNQGYVDILIK